MNVYDIANDLAQQIKKIRRICKLQNGKRSNKTKQQTIRRNKKL